MTTSDDRPHEPIPTWFGAVWFRFRAACFQARRGLLDRLPGRAPRHRAADSLEEAPVAGSWRSDLWREQGEGTERQLELGKVQNLRAALRHLSGIVVPAGATFSFWRQVGRATRRRGFAVGRELREGCVIPTIGGGLCQLSGALYNAALQAGMEIVERHSHTREGTSRLARAGRDATVFWNYVDLRFRAPFPWRLEARLTSDQLIVEIRAKIARPASTDFLLPRIAAGEGTAHAPEACGTCGVEACFRHARAAAPDTVDRTAILVDEFWPEFDAWLAQQHFPRALLCRPMDGLRWRKPNYAWSGRGVEQTREITFLTLRRALAMRGVQEQGALRQAASLAWDEKLARAYARQLRAEHSHLVVSQNLLPFLWRDGFLGGRSFEVLMLRQPLGVLHAQLDAAAALHPSSRTCADFRAPAELLAAETAALAAASRWITPHRALAAAAGDRAVLLPWLLPAARALPAASPRRIVFPASTLCRKGAYEVRAAARALGLEVICLGAQLEGPDFWSGLSRPAAGADWLAGASAVVLPAFVEHRPRRLLAAIACGVPVIATAACGVSGMPGVQTVQPGDVHALVEGLKEVSRADGARPAKTFAAR